MDDKKAIEDSLALDTMGAIVHAHRNLGDTAQTLWDIGYRLDPYPNGKSKPELIARIEALEAERDRTRFFLRQSHDDMIVATFPGLTMQAKREDHMKMSHGCRICTFLDETSSVKP